VRGSVRVAAVVVVLGTLLGAVAAPADLIPPEVQQAFDQEALSFIHRIADNGEGGPNVYEDADRIANITAVHAFTPEFLRGEKTDIVYTATGEWIGTVQAGFSSIGTVTVTWYSMVEAPTVTAFDGDADLGGALDEVTGATLVIDPRSGAAFAVYGDTIGPLNAASAELLPAPESIEDFQPTIAARSDEGGSTATPPWMYAVGIGALALVVLGIGIAAVWLPVRRRTVTPPGR
jgi:hypothetical protein